MWLVHFLIFFFNLYALKGLYFIIIRNLKGLVILIFNENFVRVNKVRIKLYLKSLILFVF